MAADSLEVGCLCTLSIPLMTDWAGWDSEQACFPIYLLLSSPLSTPLCMHVKDTSFSFLVIGQGENQHATIPHPSPGWHSSATVP